MLTPMQNTAIPNTNTARKCPDNGSKISPSENGSKTDNCSKSGDELTAEVSLREAVVKGDTKSSHELVMIGMDLNKKANPKSSLNNSVLRSKTDSTISRLNENMSDPAQSKPKKSSKSQAKSKSDVAQLMQANKQQSDCIVELERRLNELSQFNEILRKRISLCSGTANDGSQSTVHASVHNPGTPLNLPSRPNDQSESKVFQDKETNILPPLVYQIMIELWN